MNLLSHPSASEKVLSSLRVLQSRELGATFHEDSLTSRYYKHMKRTRDWQAVDGMAAHGSVFNLEFSPSGKILAAACEKETILLFDPLSRTLVSRIHPAHQNCVNCICFLDDRTFASGSDDHTIALWDTRMLRGHVTKLVGHGSLVKNLIYHRSAAQLVSSGYDGTIRLWDINSYSNDEVKSKIVLVVKFLSRAELSPREDKLLVSTFKGTLTVYHNLDMNTLQADIMNEVLENPFGVRDSSSRGDFQNGRNVEERITDFPHRPWYMSSLKIHPYGWCVMSRYTSAKTNREHTVVHDIQSVPNGKHDIQSVPNDPTSQSNNIKRLSHYIEESNTARGYIKEQYFSKDGRVIASPFGNGTRLLAFGAECGEMCDYDRPEATQLHEIKYLLSHNHAVCTSKFSPTHTLLATGCLGGKVVFHEPNF